MSGKGCLVYIVVLVVVGLLLILSSGFLTNLGINTILPEPVLPTILLPAEAITETTEILGFKTGFTNTLLATLLADIVLIALAFFGTRKLRAGDESALIPSGMQNFLELLIEALYNMAEGILGKRTRKVFWLGATIFLFILVANWMELIPGFDSIGWLEHPHEEGIAAYDYSELGPLYLLKGPAIEAAEETHQEEEAGEGHHEAAGWVLVPFLRAANTDLNTTVALAVIAVVMIQVYTIQAHGFGGYLGKFLQTKSIGKGNPMGIIDTIVGLLEAISEFSKIISFAFRLFGNVFAGAVLLFVMAFLIPFLFPGLMIFYGLEIFVGAIQAFVFMMLTFVFISASTAAHGEGH
ncbi:MAG: F0F1 ATP synthase subunit A [Anaerolineales bacterium]|nr:F0F1 ATP synthase subunit A [Anaerolineales bacterium]